MLCACGLSHFCVGINSEKNGSLESNKIIKECENSRLNFIDLTLCMLGNFACFFVVSGFFF